MPEFRNNEGDVIDVPAGLAGFVAQRGYSPLEPSAEPTPEPESAPTSPAVPLTDPSAGDNDSKGVTND